MSTLGSYPTRTFKESQKFLVLDPETQSTSLVLGRDLVEYITPQSTYVFAEQSRAVAQNEDYQIGALIQTAGDLTAGDNFAGTFLVVPGGGGDFPMANGNDLLIIKGDILLREQLASNTPAQGSSLIAHTGTTDTVTEALDRRTIYVGSVAELEALSPSSGQVVTLSDELRYGDFVFISGDRSAKVSLDPEQGVWIAPSSDPTGASGAWMRRYEALSGDAGLNPLWFGATGDGVTDDTVSVQACVDYSHVATVGKGTPISFPAGTFLCNIVDEGNRDIKWTGAGLTNTILKSPVNNEFAVKLERTFRTSLISDMKFLGDSKNTHGLYVNTGSEVRLTNVEFEACGIGYLCNSTINNTYNQCVWRSNYVSAYFTTRKTGGVMGLSIPDVNGQTVTVTDAFFESHPSVSHFNGCLIKTSNIGFVADDGDNQFQADMSYSFYDTNVEANGIGIIYEDDFLALANFRYAYHLNCWFEGNGSTTDTLFNGVTYPSAQAGELIQKSGYTIWENINFSELYLSGTAVMEMKSCGFRSENAAVVTADKSSIIADLLWGENAKVTSANLVARTVITGSNRATVYKTPVVKNTSHFVETEWSNQDFIGDPSDTFGTVTTTDVTDGVFSTEECKEHTSATGGPRFVIAQKSAGNYLVVLFTAKWISGDKNWLLSGVDASSPAGSGGTITFSDKWETYALVNRFSESAAGIGTNFMRPASGVSSTIRTSGRCALVFDTLAEVKSFFDSRNFALIR